MIYAELLGSEIGLAADDPRLGACLTAFKRMLRKPGHALQELETLEDPPRAEALEEFWIRFRAALPRFEGDVTAAGRELSRGVDLILGS